MPIGEEINQGSRNEAEDHTGCGTSKAPPMDKADRGPDSNGSGNSVRKQVKVRLLGSAHRHRVAHGKSRADRDQREHGHQPRVGSVFSAKEDVFRAPGKKRQETSEAQRPNDKAKTHE